MKFFINYSKLLWPGTAWPMLQHSCQISVVPLLGTVCLFLDARGIQVQSQVIIANMCSYILKMELRILLSKCPRAYMMVKDYVPPIDYPEDIVKGNYERKLHIPGGSAYVRMFPQSTTQGE